MTTSNFNNINLGQQGMFDSLTTPVIADGAITAQKIGTLSSVAIQDITYTAATGGTSGNAISITYIESVLPGHETVEVSSSAITVNIGNSTFSIVEVIDATHLVVSSTEGMQAGDTITQGLTTTTISSIVNVSELQVISTSGFVIGNAVDTGLLSTATQVLAAIQNSYLASVLVTAAITGTPSNKQVAVSTTDLSGGVSSAVVTSIHADSHPNLIGAIQLVSGTNVTLSQSGQAITISSSGGGSGITQLTGDVTAGPGSGSQVATLASTLTGKTFTSAVTVNPATDQLILGGVSSGNTITLTAPAPSVSRVYTIPDAGNDASFIMDHGANQGIVGNLSVVFMTADEFILSNDGILTGINTDHASGSPQNIIIPDTGSGSTSHFVVTAPISQTLSGTYTFTNAPIFPLTSADILVGNGSNSATAVSLSGDATLSNIGALTLSTVNSNVGSFTNANITVDAKGRITAASNGSGGGGGSPGGSSGDVQFNNAGSFDGDGNLTYSSGTLTFGKAPVYPISSFSASGGTIIPDATMGTTVLITVDSSCVINGPTSPYSGQKILFVLTQDSTGHSVTFTTSGSGNFKFFPDGTTFTASGANKIDYVGAIYNAALSLWDIVSIVTESGVFYLSSTLSSANIFVGNGSDIATGVALSGDASISNTGALTFNTVNSNVGSFTNANVTVNAKGLITAISNGSGGGGSLPQVISVTSLASESFTSSSYTSSSALTTSATLQKATNKWLVTLSVSAWYSSNISDSAIIVSVFRDAVDLSQGAGSGLLKNAAIANIVSPGTYRLLDAPGDTSAHTYTVKVKNQDNSTVVLLNDGSGFNSLILEEVLS